MGDGNYFYPIKREFLNLSGGTVTGNTLFTANLSATTIFSGGTNLYNIITSIVTGSTTSGGASISNGINTFTAGTSSNASVNITGASLDNLTVSGNSNLQNLTASTLSATTYSGAGMTIKGMLNLDDDITLTANPDLSIKSIYNQRILFHDNNTNAEWFLHTQAFGGGAGYGNIGFGTQSNNAANFFTINTAGTTNITRLGVNTNTPRERFEINGSAYISGNLTASTLSATTGLSIGLATTPTGPFPIFVGIDQNARTALRLDNSQAGSAAGAGVEFRSNGGNALIALLSSSNVTFPVNSVSNVNFANGGFAWITTSNNIVRARLLDDGKFGLGTLTPIEQLHVTGNTLIGGGLTATTATISGNTIIHPTSNIFTKTTIRESIAVANQAAIYLGVGTPSTTNHTLQYSSNNQVLNMNTEGSITFSRNNGAANMNISNGGLIFIGGGTSATAKLHLGVGTTATAPLKFSNGSLLTLPESGATEWNGTNLFITNNSSVRNQLAYISDLTGSTGYVPYSGAVSNVNLGTFNLSANTVSATTLYISGLTNIGNATSTNQRIVRIGQDTAYMDFGSLPLSTGNPGIWFNTATPNASNYSLALVGSSININSPNGGDIVFRHNGTSAGSINWNSWNVSPIAVTFGSYTSYNFTKPNNTNQTSGTSVNGLLHTLGSRQWVGGNITDNQNEVYYTQPLYTFTTPSTATSVSTIAIAGAPSASTNTYLSSTSALLIERGYVGTAVTNSYGIFAHAQSGATNNFAGAFSGNVQVLAGSIANQGIVIRDWTAGNTLGAIYMGVVPSSTNYTLLGDVSNINTYLNAASAVHFRIANVTAAQFTSTSLTFAEGTNLSFGTSTGTRIGLSTTAKFAFWNNIPIIQPTSGTSLNRVLSDTGLIGTGATAAYFDLPISSTTISADTIFASTGLGIGATPNATTIPINISRAQNGETKIYVQNTNAGAGAAASLQFLNNSNDAKILQASTGNSNYTPNALNFYQSTTGGFDFYTRAVSTLRIKDSGDTVFRSMSTTGFTVQSLTSTTNVFVVDTLNSRVGVNVSATAGYAFGVNGGVHVAGSGIVVNSDLAAQSASRNFVFIPNTTEGIIVNRRATVTPCLTLGADANSNATLNVTNADYIFSISTIEKMRLSTNNVFSINVPTSASAFTATSISNGLQSMTGFQTNLTGMTKVSGLTVAGPIIDFDGTSTNAYLRNTVGNLRIVAASGADTIFDIGASAAVFRVRAGDLQFSAGYNITISTGSTGTRIGTANSQFLSFWNATPIIQPTSGTSINKVLSETGLIATGLTSYFSHPLGVGTSAPNGQLHVSGTTSGSLFRITNSAGNTGFLMDNGDLKSQFYGNGGLDYPGVTSTASNQMGIGFSSNAVGLIGASVAHLILSGGNIGIGLGSFAAPLAKLDVSGNTLFRSNSTSGLSVFNSTGTTAVFRVDTVGGNVYVNNLTAATVSATTYYNDTEQIFGNVIKATAPINTGNTWTRNTDYEQFIYDGVRTKWLSSSEQRLTGARNSSATTQFLSYEDGMFYSTTPFRVPYDATITKLVMAGSVSETWQAFITTGTTLATDFVAILGMSSNVYSAKTDYNININSGQTLYIGMSGSSIAYPRVDVYFKQRG